MLKYRRTNDRTGHHEDLVFRTFQSPLFCEKTGQPTAEAVRQGEQIVREWNKEDVGWSYELLKPEVSSVST
jgi:hypothetical protein